MVVTPAKARPLLQGTRTQTELSQGDWARLQQIAGPAPTRGPCWGWSESATSSSSCNHGQEQPAFGTGKGSGGPDRDRCSVGSAAQWGKSFGTTADHPGSAELLASATAGGGEALRSTSSRPQRLGQRVRKQLRCKGLRDSGGLSQDHFGPGWHCGGGEAERHDRAWDDSRSRRLLDHAKVCREEDGPPGSQNSGLHRHAGCGGLGHSPRIKQSGNDGVHIEAPDVSGTNLFGSGKNATGLAIDGVHGPGIQLAPQHESAWGLEALLDPGQTKLGVRQHRLPEGSRLSRRQDGNYREGSKGLSRRRRRRSGQTSKAYTQEETTKGSGKRRSERGRNSMSPTGAAGDQLSSGGASSDEVDAKSLLGEFCSLGASDKSHKLDSVDLPDDLPNLSCDKFFSPPELIMQTCNTIMKSHTGLSRFVASSLDSSASCNVDDCPQANQLWPVPPPRWRWSGSLNLGKTRRKRRARLRARNQLLQFVVICLNWETLGHPPLAPLRARAGSFLSVQQHRILERLEDQISHYMAVGDFSSDGLGRAAAKFQDLINLCKELPQCKVGAEDLESIVAALHASFDPYSAQLDRPYNGTSQSEPSHDCQLPRAEIRPAVNCNSRPVVADRVKWENPPSFRAEDFLDNELVKAAFIDPEVLRKPVECWPKLPGARVQCGRDELLALARRWDSLGACELVPASAKNFDEAVGMFSIPKDSKYDRLIINPTVINSRMFKVSDATKTLAPGSMLGLLSLGPEDGFRFSADDLTDFYYTFQVSYKRATRNAFRMKFKSWEVRDLKCFRPEWEGQELLICLSTLAMGDSLAVEIAQQSHANVLCKLCGALLEHETLRYRAPCPRGDFIELLAIDDHVGVQRVPLKSLSNQPELRDTQVFSASEKAYKKVGLVQHEKKRKRNQVSGTILGADFDGIKGRVMAPRDRIMILSVITSWIARTGTCAFHVLSMVLGCWIHVLLFRRALFSIVDSLFKEGRNGKKHEVFCLSRQSRNELQLLSILGCVSHADLRAKYDTQIYCTDASPWGGAVCAAPVTEAFCGEIWRHCEQKGYYTKLQSPAAAYLSEKGLPSEAVEALAPEPLSCSHGDIFEPVPAALTEGILFDCVEIFRGAGAWSEFHQAAGLIVHDGFDIDGCRLRVGDLMNMDTFREIVSLALRKVVAEWHCGLPCLSFGTLRRPQVRSIQHPFGFRPDDPFTHFHNILPSEQLSF